MKKTIAIYLVLIAASYVGSWYITGMGLAMAPADQQESI